LLGTYTIPQAKAHMHAAGIPVDSDMSIKNWLTIAATNTRLNAKLDRRAQRRQSDKAMKIRRSR
jgi:hypothetical protein